MIYGVALAVVLAVVGPPFALGLLARFWRTGSRAGTWYWRLWWYYACHWGFYRINRAWKNRQGRRHRVCLESIDRLERELFPE